MELVAVDTQSRKSNNGQSPPQEKIESPKDLGPTFYELDGRRRRRLILNYAWRHHRSRIVIIILCLIVVLLGTLFCKELHFPNTFSEAPKSLIDWLINAQSIFGLGTLIVALSVWWGEIQEDWEDELPRKLSVFFFEKEHALIVCRYAWLAGADEIRTWGQQIAFQAQPPAKTPLKLDFGADVETKKPILLSGPRDEIWKHYSVCFRLTNLNETLKKYVAENRGFCRYQNLAAKKTITHDAAQKLVETIPEVAEWKTIVSQKLS